MSDVYDNNDDDDIDNKQTSFWRTLVNSIYRCCMIKLKTVIKVIVRLVDKHKYNLKKMVE